MASFVQTKSGTMVRVTLGYKDGKQVKKSKTFKKGVHKSTMEQWVKEVTEHYNKSYEVQLSNGRVGKVTWVSSGSTIEDDPSALNLSMKVLTKHFSKDFDEVCDEFLAMKRLEGLAPRTLKEYESEIRLYIRGKLPKVAKVKTKDVQALMSNYTHLSPRSQNKIRTIISMIFNLAVDRDYISQNPITKSVKVPKQKSQKKITVLDVTEFDMVLEKCEDLGLLTLFYTGLRISELLALKKEHIKGDYIRVEVALDGLYHNPRRVGDVKSDYSKRTIKIYKGLKEKLAVRLAEMSSNDFVFTASYETYRTRLKKLCKSLDLPEMTLHDIRHSNCTYLLAQGVNAQVVCKLLGHHSPSFTISQYGHLLPSMDDKLMEVFG